MAHEHDLIVRLDVPLTFFADGEFGAEQLEMLRSYLHQVLNGDAGDRCFHGNLGRHGIEVIIKTIPRLFNRQDGDYDGPRMRDTYLNSLTCGDAIGVDILRRSAAGKEQPCLGSTGSIS